MKLWNDLRNYFYQKNIVAKLKELSPARSLTNLHDAKTLGIVYDSTNPDNDAAISKFAEQLRANGKTVEILAFINDKKIEAKPGIELFNTKNLSWNLTPVDERVEKFAAQKFDLLLACFMDSSYPLEYIVRTSRAKWRVGHFSEQKTDYYEMMINTDSKKELSYFLQQATHFLNAIKYDSK